MEIVEEMAFTSMNTSPRLCCGSLAGGSAGVFTSTSGGPEGLGLLALVGRGAGVLAAARFLGGITYKRKW